jgi:predicted nucleotidyltransferase
LFGSYRKGEDISTSDIDIAIEDNDTKDHQTHPLREPDFEKLLGRNIQIHLFSRKNVDHNVFNNIANGIVLSGFLEVRR